MGEAAVTVYAALLRAINVSGTGILRMADLKALCEELGFRGVTTLLQSGNVVFSAGGAEASVAKKLAGAIERRHGFRPAVMLRTADELEDAIVRNPFAAQAKKDPTRVVLVFLESAAAKGAEERLAAVKLNREKLVLSGRELFALYPDGQGRSKVTNAVLERAFGVPATARNWNTVEKLLALARKLEAA